MGEGIFLVAFALLLPIVIYGLHDFTGSVGLGTAGMLGVVLTKVGSIVQVASGRPGAVIASFLFPVLFIEVAMMFNASALTGWEYQKLKENPYLGK